jgi:hypothetical protein
MLSPHPHNQTPECVSTLCSSTNTPIKPPPHNNIRCPQKPMVTVHQLGQLGNQMYEYNSFSVIAKKTGREHYVPSCMIQELEKILEIVTVFPLSYLAYCTIQKYRVQIHVDVIDHFNGSMLLPSFAQIHKYAPLFIDI